MKKFKIIGLLLVLALLFVACGKTEDEPVADTEVEQDAGENVEIKDNTQDTGENVENKENAEDVADNADETEVVEEEKPQIDWSTAKSVWTTTDSNLREEPNTDCKVITTLAKGTELKKGSEEDGWAYIKSGDYIGYVSMKYVADSKPKEEEKPSASTTKNEQKPSGSSSKVEAIPGQFRDPNNIVVVIDPGHQGKGDSAKEANGPGSSTMKARVTSGCTGVASGIPEYKLTLEISLMLRTELENRGYKVYMTRSTHDVNISNKERAQYASSVGADIAVRIHADSVDNSSVRGATALAPSKNNAYVSHLASASQSLSSKIMASYCGATGFKNRGVQANDTMTGINWSEVPVTIVELGFMSNPEEDMAMQDDAMQNNMVQGIANGIDNYFGL